MFTQLLYQSNLISIDSAAVINGREMLLDAAKMINELSFQAGTPDSEPSAAQLAEAASLSSELLAAADRLDVLSMETISKGDK